MFFLVEYIIFTYVGGKLASTIMCEKEYSYSIIIFLEKYLLNIF